MGAGSSGESPAAAQGAPPAVAAAASASAVRPAELRRIALLSESQLAALEQELADLGAQAAAGVGTGDEWPLVFFDNAAFALTLQGWWLAEQGGTWRLRVPSYAPATGTSAPRLQGHEELVSPADILERAGLVKHAEALRTGAANNVERLLAQAGVHPIARMRCERREFELRRTEAGELAPQGSPRGGRSVRMSLARLRLDPEYAEHAAIAEALFERGAGARSLLQAGLADFRLALPADAAGGAAAAADAELGATLAARGCLACVAPLAAFPEAVAYIWALRPCHLRALRRAGVACVSQGEE